MKGNNQSNNKKQNNQKQTKVKQPNNTQKQQMSGQPKNANRGSTNDRGSFMTRFRSVGAGVSVSTRGIGMSDLINHRISYLTGYIYVGNGTLGATDSVYFVDPTVTDTVLGVVAILPSDTLIGATYVADVDKHFARKVIKQCRLRLEPLFPSTSNSMSVIIGPLRGPATSSVSALKTDNTASNTYTNVLSLSGSKQCASWEDLEIDLTPYIAGGSGARQNEFPISGVTSGVSFGGAGFNPTGVCCCFAVSGNSSTTALRATKTHAVIIEQVVDLLDFVGGTVANPPEA